jgi:hypothetical protein
VDDILVFIRIEAIDGAGGILGEAGPCAVDQSNYVRVGIIYLDSADYANLKQAGQIQSVILHELGHVLGVGTLWEDFDLVPASVDGSGHLLYQGSSGNAGNVQIGGTGSARVEDTGGAGTARSHWKETVYGSELMTGYLSGTSQPLSKLTARSLEDIGFVVNASFADSYIFGASIQDEERRRRRLRTRLPWIKPMRMGADVWKGRRTVLRTERVKPGREREWNATLARAHMIRQKRQGLSTGGGAGG